MTYFCLGKESLQFEAIRYEKRVNRYDNDRNHYGKGNNHYGFHHNRYFYHLMEKTSVIITQKINYLFFINPISPGKSNFNPDYTAN
jgi:hypothetical protein